jgi:hypothetical protein
MKSSLVVEFSGKKTDDKALLKAAKEAWAEKGKLVKDLQSVDLYLKPEESKCYYVFNGEDHGFIEI